MQKKVNFVGKSHDFISKRKASVTFLTGITSILKRSLSTFCSIGTSIFLNPNFCASCMRCSMRLTGRISPANPTSPHKQMVGSSAMSMLLLSTAARTARSIAGSCTRRPFYLTLVSD